MSNAVHMGSKISKRYCTFAGILVLVGAIAWLVLPVKSVAAPKTAPANLALKAKAAASSSFSGAYLAKFACDGKIPAAGGRRDLNQAWVAKGNNHPKGVTFKLQWAKPVSIAEVVYYGRTGFDWRENWKDYEVYLDDAKVRVAKGKLLCGHGPQRIKLAKPQKAASLTLLFKSSHGGPNPGASEIQIYSTTPSDKLLGKFSKPRHTSPGQVSVPEIEGSTELAAKLKSGKLGFTKMMVVQRHHIRCSHVYTYHCEGQKNGGGLFIYDVTNGKK
ncbi:MAG: discoidin domain-containing protein, partial [Phycisphaerae bacterium]|nr:discoidin domain-containing protein [Phycisphaerae bacterium]